MYLTDQRGRFVIFRKHYHDTATLTQSVFIDENLVFGQALSDGLLHFATGSRADGGAGRSEDRRTQQPERSNRPKPGDQRHQKRASSEPDSSARQSAHRLPHARLLGRIRGNGLHFLVQFVHRARRQKRDSVGGDACLEGFIHGVLAAGSCAEHSTDRFHASHPHFIELEPRTGPIPMRR